MELKTNYQYTYFIYPFAIKKESYGAYVKFLMKHKNYQIKLFDSFCHERFSHFFVPSIRKGFFQDLNFHKENKDAFYQLKGKQQFHQLSHQKCLIFEYRIQHEIQGKLKEKDGIFFTIPKIELICFQTGICFLLIKVHLTETNSFEDILNFNYQFQKMAMNQPNIKMQNDKFENMDTVSKIIEELTGHPFESKKIDRNENSFLVYTYTCLDSLYWNKEADFENIENEFIKLAQVKPSDTNINVEYEKLSVLANSRFMRLRINNKASALICSSTDANNYTKLAETYEQEYLYTYMIALHQKYCLKMIHNSFQNQQEKKAVKQLLFFTKNSWISDLTEDDFGKKIYTRCKEKFNLKELFDEAKCKFELFCKQQNYKKNKWWSILLFIVMVFATIGNICIWKF